MPQRDDPIRRLIERRHPEYRRNISEWTFRRQAYESLPCEYAEKNLHRHPREGDKVFQARCGRAADHRYNLTAEVIECYLGYLFQQAPAAADGLPESAATFLAQADREGRPAVDVARDAAAWLADQGTIWMAVDKPPLPAQDAPPDGDGDAAPMSAQQERELGLKPYAYIVLPSHVLDWRMKDGKLEWLLVQEDERDDADPLLSSGEETVQWRLWTTTGWTLYRMVEAATANREAVYAEVGRGQHDVGEVPFVRVQMAKGKGLVAEIAHVDRAIFNHMSLVDEIHYGVTFPQLVYPHDQDVYTSRTVGEGDDATTETGLSAAGKAILEVGTNDVIPYPVTENGAHKPEYISPPSEPAQELRQSIQEMVRLALALAALDGEVATETEEGGAKQAASGVSKAYTFEKLNKRLAGFADTLQTAFAKVLRLVALWQGEDPGELPDVPWDFPDQFEVQSLDHQVALASELLEANPPSKTFRAELWKDVAHLVFKKRDAKLLEQIDQELEAGAEQAVAGGGGDLQADRQATEEKGEEQDGA